MSKTTAGSLTVMSPINLFQYELHIYDMGNFEVNTLLILCNNNHPCTVLYLSEVTLMVESDVYAQNCMVKRVISL